MSKVNKSITELVGKTPLLELVNYEKKHNLEAKILVKLEYFNPAVSLAREIGKAYNNGKVIDPDRPSALHDSLRRTDQLYPYPWMNRQARRNRYFLTRQQ